MDKANDRIRYFRVLSVIVEVVAPMLRERLENHFKGLGYSTLQIFLNEQHVLHTLFHLRFKTTRVCCTDSINCPNGSNSPIVYNQWNLMYTASARQKCGRLCFCKFTAKPVKLEDLDVTLTSLLLVECCLQSNEIKIITFLREVKNNVSHNTDGCIEHDEFDTLWPKIVEKVTQLDKDKEDDLVRIQKRSFDPGLCEKYKIELMDVCQKLQEIEEKVDSLPEIIMQMICRVFGKLLTKKLYSTETEMDTDVASKYKLGMDIFCSKYTELNVNSVSDTKLEGRICDGFMTNDSRIVLCLYEMKTLLICNVDGFSLHTIGLAGAPWRVTAVSQSTVAITLPFRRNVVMYDINKRKELQSISLPENCWGITTNDNSLIVGGNLKIWVIDLATRQVTSSLSTNDLTSNLHCSGDVLYSYGIPSNKLFCYKLSGDSLDEKLFTSNLQFTISGITSLRDGSLYVPCSRRSVYHVSPDGRDYKIVTTDGFARSWCLNYPNYISYNKRSRKLLVGYIDNIVRIFHEE